MNKTAVIIAAFILLAVSFTFLLISENRTEYTRTLAHSYCNQKMKVFFDMRLNGTHWVCTPVEGGDEVVYGFTPSDIPHIGGGVAS